MADMGGVGGWSARSVRISTTFVSSAVGMAAGLVQVGVVTELGLEGSVYKGKRKKNLVTMVITRICCFTKQEIPRMLQITTLLLTQRQLLLGVTSQR